MEDNKLIAEFMSDGEFRHNEELLYTFNKHPCSYINNGATCSLEDLFYHSRWDWLMPVVEKIESLGYIFDIWKTTCEWYKPFEANYAIEHSAKTKIEAVYKAVIEFIKYYNKNQ